MSAQGPFPAMPKLLVPIVATVFVMLFLWLSAVPLLSWYEFSAYHQELADESFRWRHRGIVNYSFEFESRDPKTRPNPGPIRIHVRDAKFLAAYRIDTHTLVDTAALADVPDTIDSAFEMVRALLEAHPYRIDIEYHADLHYPKRMSVSYSDLSHDGATYYIRWFEKDYDRP